jgi:antitoxin PrlF
MEKSKAGEKKGPDASKSLNIGCCRIEALVTVDGRGQLVLPKEFRDKAGIKAGDKFAVVNWEQAGEVCCITLIKADDFAGTVKTMLGPIMKEILE